MEIERKFLLKSEDWRTFVRASLPMRQGYLGGSRCSVRVRVSGDQAWLNIKSLDRGVAREEFEYEIPLADGHRLLNELAAGPLVEKIRHLVDYQGLTWEIDEFLGDNQGLIVAEVELERIDQPIPLPPWAGLEVTHQERYYNLRLAEHPYCRWTQAEGRDEPC